MREASALERFVALSVRSGLSLGILRASRIADFNLMLAAAAHAFAAGRTYAEGKKIGWRDGFRAVYAILKYNVWHRR